MTVFREEATSALAGFYVGPLSWWNLVSFAAVIRVVTQRSSPLTEQRCVTTLITAAKETRWNWDLQVLVAKGLVVLFRFVFGLRDYHDFDVTSIGCL